MKVKNKVLLAVTTALLGCSAHVAAKDNPYVKQYCSGVSDIAALVMIQRQSGVPINEVMKSDSEYDTELGAFNAYKVEKEIFVKELAEKWKDKIDERAYNALISYQVGIDD